MLIALIILFLQKQIRSFSEKTNMQIQSVAYRAEKREDLATEIINRLRDARSYKKLFSDFNKSIQREKQVMIALQALHTAYGYQAYFDKITEDEQSGLDLHTDAPHNNPDYFYFLKKSGKKSYITVTYEIKTNSTNTFLNDTVFIKRPAIWTMNNYRDKYPLGRVIISTKTQFSIIGVDKIIKYPQIETENWGNKKMYHIPVSDLTWNSWLVPIIDW